MYTSKENYGGKQLLYDVVIMRLILIVMLLVYHAFAPFCGGWTPFDEASSNTIYFWIGKFSYSFFLEAFVFISGLIAGYQAKTKPISYHYKYISKKFRRLIIPSIVFSIIYFICFYEWNGIISFANSITEGCGHMWFLPMLFWCFVGLTLLSYVNINPYVTLGFSLMLLMLSNGFLPLRIGYSMYYFIFFYLGYLTYKENFKRYFKSNHILIIILFIIFVFSVIMYEYYIPSSGIKSILTQHLIRGIIGFTGLSVCYIIVSKIAQNITHLPKWIVMFSQYSFGIYIMQQFILKALYYHTSFPSIVDFRVIPWIGLICALIFSIILTNVLLKFRIGRLLIG